MTRETIHSWSDTFFVAAWQAFFGSIAILAGFCWQGCLIACLVCLIIANVIRLRNERAVRAIVFILAAAVACTARAQICEVHFSAPAWCQPCREMIPEIEKARAAGVDIREVNVDKQHDLAIAYHVTGIPVTVCVLSTPRGSYELGRIVGYATAGQLIRLRAVPAVATVGAATRNAFQALFNCPPILSW